MNTRPDLSPARPRLAACFETLRDPRIDRTRDHKLLDILVIGLCSILSGGEGFNDMEFFGKVRHDWLKTFLELPHGIPSHDTFNRVFSALDPERFLECFVQWVQGVCHALSGSVIAIDGKALRHALDAGASIPYIVSAWASDHGLVLAQVKVDDKSNEITAIPELLRVLELHGCLVTIDAMGCQKEIAEQIVDKGADYVLALKGNHATAHEEFQEYFDDAVPPDATVPAATVPPGTMDACQTLDKDHGRLETRRYWQTTDIDWFQDKPLWKNLRSVGMVESTRLIQGQSTTERRYYLSSLPLDVHPFAHAVRQHWGVENPLHWTLDVTFREDASRARTHHAAQNLALLRRLALNLVKNDQSQKLPIRRKRMLAALDPDYLKRLLEI